MPCSSCRGKAIQVVVAFVLTLGAALQPAAAQNEDEIFNRAFGEHKKAADKEVALTLLFQGRSLGTVRGTYPAAGGEPSVRLGDLCSRIGEIVRSELARQLAAAAGEGLVSLTRLRQLGVDLELDAASLDLHLHVAPGDLAQADLPLREDGPPSFGGEAIAPAGSSAYVNVRLGAGLHAGGSAAGLQPLHLQVEPAVDFGPTVLQGLIQWDQGTLPQLGNLSLVHDDVNQLLRWIGGVVSYPVRGFQSFIPGLGVAVARDLSLAPYRITQPLGQTEFLLTSDSRVEVQVNGRTERTLRLPAGRYNVHDFFLESGLNDVVLLITDAAGRSERIELSLAFQNDLLRPGLSSFAAAAGMESTVGTDGPTYHPERPFVSGLWRQGMGETWTAGGGLQADRDGGLATGEALVALPWGALNFATALSGRAVGLGGGAQLAYERFDAGAANPSARRWSLQASYSTPRFRAPGDTTVTQPRSGAGLQLKLSQRLGNRTSAGMALDVSGPATGAATAGGATFSLRRAAGKKANVSLDLGWKIDALHRVERRLAVSWSLALADRRQQIDSSYDSASRASRLEWTDAPSKPVGAWALSAVSATSPDGDSATAEARWTGQRGEADWTLSGDKEGAAVALQAAASVVLADGHVAIGRPVNGAFALLAPDPSLAGCTIGADRNSNSYGVEAVRWGGVVPDLVPYMSRSLAVEVADLPAGFDPGPGLFLLVPRYKSGTLVPVGTGANLALGGILVDSEGKPVALASGNVTAAKGAPKIFFTNRAGRFRVEGLRAGKVELHLDDGRHLALQVAEGQTGVVDLGVLRLPAEAAS